MRTTIARLAPLAAIAALTLAGCSGAERQPADTPPVEQPQADGDVADEIEDDPLWGQGTYTAETSYGTKLTIEIPGDTPEDIDAYREKTGAEDVTYITIDIDNSNGDEDFGASDLTIIGGDGTSYEFESAFIPIGEWEPRMRDDGPEDVNQGYYYEMSDGTEISEEEYAELSREGTELYNKYLNGGALPREKASKVMIGPDELPDEIAYVELLSGMEPLPATPIDWP